MFALPSLPGFVLSQIRAAPSLTVAHCPTEINFFRSNSSMSWHDPAFQGLLVYTFTSVTGDELVHIRSRTRVELDDPCVGYWKPMWTFRWEEKGWFNEVELPVRVLNAVYAAAGLEKNTTEPGRGKTLPEKGWEVVRYWRMHE